MIRARIWRRAGRQVALGVALCLTAASGAASADSSDAWAALAAGGNVAVIRHGNAPPGFGGDPPGMRIEDCRTQRNLDDKGREQARAVGEAFRMHGVQVARILSSPMCRCLETARLMDVGSVETSSALLPDRDRQIRPRLAELKELVSAWRGPGTLVLVTHGYTVENLIGIIPGQAETLVFKPAPGSGPGGQLIGRIAAP